MTAGTSAAAEPDRLSGRKITLYEKTQAYFYVNFLPGIEWDDPVFKDRFCAGGNTGDPRRLY